MRRPVLQAMGKTITHFGQNGSGQAAKATNQIMCAGIIEAVSEAMAFAKAQSLPLDRVVETLGKGAGSSWYFVHRAPNMVRGTYPAGFRVRLHAKDLAICRDMAARFGVTLPVVERMLDEYAELVARGYGDEDISATYRLKSELFDRPDPASHEDRRAPATLTKTITSRISALRAPRSRSCSSSSSRSLVLALARADPNIGFWLELSRTLAAF